MTIYFMDSSALIKRYVTETGSDWVQSLADPVAGHTLIVARITWVEVLSAFARLQREGNLSTDDIDTTMRAFRYDWDTQYQIVEMDTPLALSAGELLFRQPLRALDSIQLAAALRLLPAFGRAPTITYTFVAADDRLLQAADAEGLSTENPNMHTQEYGAPLDE